jgi:hypothetical protein
MTGPDRLPLLAGRTCCTRCNRRMEVRSAAGFRWYTCRCPRRIAVEDLDGIVLGLVYEHRRLLGERRFLTLDDEPAMIGEFVAEVRVGLDWSRPAVRWAGDPAPSSGAQLRPGPGREWG